MESNLWIKIDVLSWLFLDPRLTAYPFGGPEFTPIFLWVHIARSLVYCVVFCILLFVLLPIVLSVILRFTDYDYPFGIINLFLQWLEHERAKDWLNWKSCNDVYSISLNVFFIKDSTKVHMTWLIKIQLNMILYYLLIKYEIWYRTLLQTVCIII
jgi:hypothetical protein